MCLVAPPRLSPPIVLRVALSAPRRALPRQGLFGIVPRFPHRVLRVLRHCSLTEATASPVGHLTWNVVCPPNALRISRGAGQRRAGGGLQAVSTGRTRAALKPGAAGLNAPVRQPAPDLP